MALARGFKADANRMAREVRGELGLGPTAPLDPWRLADHLDVPVLALSGLVSGAPGAVAQFQEVDPSEFSAVTVFAGRRRLIVYNDAHAKGRHFSLSYAGRSWDTKRTVNASVPLPLPVLRACPGCASRRSG